MTSFQVKQFDGFSNSFTILSKDEDLQVSMDIAKQLYVEKNWLNFSSTPTNPENQIFRVFISNIWFYSPLVVECL